MGLLDAAFVGGTAVAPRASTDMFERIKRSMGGGGGGTRSGVKVTADSAMRCAAVYACVRVLAEDVAKIPLILYRRTGNGGRERATDHPLYSVLHDRANPWQTAFEFREMMQAHLELRGNAYAFITRGFRGQVLELIPIHPDRVEVSQAADYTLTFKVKGERVPNESILHLRGMSLDGIIGVSTISYARETIGLALATEKHGALLFGNGARPGMVAEAPAEMSEPAAARLKESIEQQVTGDNAFRLLMLEEGAKLSSAPVAMNNVDAQFLESQKYGRSQIAGLHRVPPHKIGDLERATFSNIEHQSQDYLDSAIDPRLVRWEQRLTQALLTPAERQNYYIEFLRLALLRGDSKARAEFYGAAIKDGWMNRQEPRERENLPPGPDSLNEFLVPLNMAPANERTGGAQDDDD